MIRYFSDWGRFLFRKRTVPNQKKGAIQLSNLEVYIEKVKKETQGLNDIEKLRYVYIDLGKRLAFDLDFSFGNTKSKQKIYHKSGTLDGIEEGLENNVIICKTLAKMYEHIMNSLGINLKTIVDDSDSRKYPHVYNILKAKDGKTYIFDLQEDMRNIKAHLRTKYFGVQADDPLKTIVSRWDLDQIDKKIGYVSKNIWYTDEYLDLIRINMNFISDFRQRVQFVLEELEAYSDEQMGYADRRWRMEDMLGGNGRDGLLFSAGESNKIHIIDCYKDIDGKRIYKLGVLVEGKGGPDIYLFSEEKNMYEKKNLKEFADFILDGWVNMQGVQGLKQVLRKKNLEADGR